MTKVISLVRYCLRPVIQGAAAYKVVGLMLPMTRHLATRCLTVVMLSLSLTAYSGVSAAVSNQVAAIVNDDVITENELQARIKRVKTDIDSPVNARYRQLSSDVELRYQVLKSLVEESVLAQRAQQLGITVAPAEIEVAMKNVANSNQLDMPQLQAKLAEDPMEEMSFSSELKANILIAKLVRATLSRSINVSQFEVDELLKTQQKPEESKQYNLSQLLIKIADPDDVTANAALLAQAQQWQQQLVAGQALKDLVESQATAVVAPVARDVGWKGPKQLPELFLSELTNMQKGEYSAVLRSPKALHILRLNDLRGGVKMVEKRSAQHILIKAQTVLERQQATNKLLSIRDAVLAGGDFSKFATDLSDDPGSAANGGELGLIKRGDTVPEFEKATYALSVGEVSQPVETQFGVHLIRLADIVQEDVAGEELRRKAYDQLLRRKTNQQYSSWLSDLVSKAYIDYL